MSPSRLEVGHQHRRCDRRSARPGPPRPSVTVVSHGTAQRTNSKRARWVVIGTVTNSACYVTVAAASATLQHRPDRERCGPPSVPADHTLPQRSRRAAETAELPARPAAAAAAAGRRVHVRVPPRSGAPEKARYWPESNAV